MVLDYYVIHLAIHQNFSHHTVKGYFYVAQAFLDFHQETKGNMNQAVQEFLKNSIYERGNLNSTLNYKKAALKKFIRFLQKFDEEQFDYNFSRLKRSTYERLHKFYLILILSAYDCLYAIQTTSNSWTN